MSIAKTKKQVNTYQPQYEPPNLTDAEQKRVESLTDSRLCNAEVDPVAGKIANAVTNPETPEKVRDYIKAYLDDHLHFDWTETPEAILCMFPIACRKISHTP